MKIIKSRMDCKKSLTGKHDFERNFIGGEYLPNSRVFLNNRAPIKYLNKSTCSNCGMTKKHNIKGAK